uniref:SH2 domain-containing protein n=1 Tax=Electrophorus electricus TaxID=8005 RepID=A0A4W4GRX4_ELEEL
MLQQILRDMYVEPELLVELSEEQRQLLFYKIRQEQVRRWAEHESQEEAQESRQHTRLLSDQKNIQWLHGSDGDVWVWVMGEAPGDRPYEQIIRELIEEKACRQAHLEAQELWCKKQAELKQKFRDAVFKEKTRLIAGKWKEEAEDRKVAKQEEEHIREELEKREEEERQSGEEEVRRAEERRARELYVSLERERHAAQQDDEEWSEQSECVFELPHASAWHSHPSLLLSAAAPRQVLLPGLPMHFSIIPISFFLLSLSPLALPSPSWVRFPRPKSRESIIAWFCEDQRPKRAGYERNSNHIAPWFHGKLILLNAERLLSHSLVAASFLPRVLSGASERDDLGLQTLSYRTPSGFKHFLIDATGDFYSFLGVDQSCHASLADLVDFHKVVKLLKKDKLKQSLFLPCWVMSLSIFCSVNQYHCI